MTSGWCKRRRGIAQGSPLSPLLANSYLNEFDRELMGRCRLVRYADDMLMMGSSRGAVEKALQAAEKSLAKLKLKLHPKKTFVVDNREAGVDFLGFRLLPDRITPTDVNVEKLKTEIARALDPARSLKSDARLQQLNSVLRSFVWYYQHTDCGRLLLSLDALVDETHGKLRQSGNRGQVPDRHGLVRLSRLRETRWQPDSSEARAAAHWNGYG